MEISLKKLNASAKIPERGSTAAAGYDLFANIDKAVLIPAGETVMIGTGIAMSIPEGYFGGVYARSGLSAKEGLRPANCTGVIDADYRGEIRVALHNDSAEERTVIPGQKIAQLLIQPFLEVTFSETESLEETKRGEGGFGSTGM